MTIERLEVIPVDVPLRRQFVIATGDLSLPGALGRVVIRLYTADGVVGYGEAVALPSVMGFTTAGLASVLRDYIAPVVVGHDESDIVGLHRLMDAAILGNQPAKAAVDIAAHDALARTMQVPVSHLLGGALRDQVPLSKSVGSDVPAKLREEIAQVVQDGFPVVKLKLTCNAEDVERVRAAAEVVGAARLRLDANAGYADDADAIRQLRQLEQFGLYLVEQPLGARDLEGMARVRSGVGVEILADESVGDEEDARAVIRYAAADVLNVKVQAAGGLLPALRVAAAARAQGMPILVGSRMESGIGAAAGLQLMAALEDTGHPCDLKGPDTYVHDLLCTSLVIQDGHAHVPQGHGLGVDIDVDQLEHYRQDS